MPANIENMMYVRETPWHGLGVKVDEALSSEEALKVAGLDWDVIQSPISCNGVEQRGWIGNVRESDNTLLGIVTDRYKVVQNKDAFAFTDALLGMGVKYETAGSLAKGKRIWMLAKLPETKVLDDIVEPYLVFTNAHDGKGAVRAAITPIRVVCQNTLNLALHSASRTWSMKHTGNIDGKMDEARIAIKLSNMYMENLNKEAEKLASIAVSQGEINDFVEQLFPFPKDIAQQSELKIERTRLDRSAFIRCYEMADIEKYRGTQLGLINAASDFATHTAPRRSSKSWNENLFMKVIDGNTILDDAYMILKAA